MNEKNINKILFLNKINLFILFEVKTPIYIKILSR